MSRGREFHKKGEAQENAPKAIGTQVLIWAN